MMIVRLLLLVISCSIASSVNAASALSELKKAQQELSNGKQEIVAGKQGLIDGYHELYNQVVVPVSQACVGVDEQLAQIKRGYDICMQIDIVAPLLGGLYGNTTTIVKHLYETVGTISATLHTVQNTVEPVNEAINPKPLPPTPIPVVYQKFDQAEKDLDAAIKQIQQIITDFGELLDVL